MRFIEFIKENKKMSAYGAPLGRTPGPKTHFVYQSNVPKTKTIVHRGTEESSKQWIKDKAKHFGHKGKDFAIYKKPKGRDIRLSDRLDFKYVHKD